MGSKESEFINSILSHGDNRIEDLISIDKSLFFIETYKIKFVDTDKYNTTIWSIRNRFYKNPRQQLVFEKRTYSYNEALAMHKKSIHVLQELIDKNKKFADSMATSDSISY